MTPSESRRRELAKVCAVRKYRDGGEVVEEYFHSVESALRWIATQESDKGKEWKWCVGEFE